MSETLILHGMDSPYAEARYAAAAEKLYRLLDTRLQTREWIAGGDYSIADMAVQPWANYLEGHGFDSAQYPALVRWRAAIAARPAVQRALIRADAAFTDPANRTRRAASNEDLDTFFGRADTVPVADFSPVREM